MKELFSKVLNWVTLTALIVWIFMNCVIFKFTDSVQFVFEFNEKLIWAIVGAVIGAGGMKAKMTADAEEKKEAEEAAAEIVPEAPAEEIRADV